MLRLSFNPTKIPRTISKEEWYEIWRWKRVTEKRLSEQIETDIINFTVYGSTWPEEMRQDYMDQLTNPPLLVSPYDSK